MKKTIFVVLLLALLPGALFAQISLTALGSASGGTMTSGDVLSWQINVPTGASVDNELWVDVNGNGVAEPGTDALLFRFTQQDGGQFFDGPGDDDGVANGTIMTSFPAGLAPADWIFISVHTSGSDTVGLTVNALTSPVATITGTVTVPAGYDKAYRIIEASPNSNSGGMSIFWHGLTDASGNYTIAMGGDPASMNPWRVSMGEGGSVQTLLIPVRRDTSVTIGIVAAVVDFDLIKGTLLTGTIRDESNNNPIEFAEVSTSPAPPGSPNNGDNYGARTGSDGVFEFVVPPGDYLLHYRGPGYFSEYWDNQVDEQNATTISVTTQDTINALDALLAKGAEITGTTRNYGMRVRAQVYLLGADSNQVDQNGTDDNGVYSFTVQPGTYYVKFEYQGNIQYYDQTTSFPGDPITVTGTDRIGNVDAQFAVGPKPLPNPPQILNIWDVPFDNGRHVYVKWTGIDRMFGGDSSGPGITSYSILRQDGPDWVFMRSVPAAMDSTYTTIVPTLEDSTKTGGMRMSTFIVRAHIAFNAFVLTSAPAQGYSLDNMAPGVPAGLGSVVSGSDVVLRWTPNEEEDFKYYSVYRSTASDFSVQGLTPYGFTATTQFVDAGAAAGTFYYRLTATDHAGNESDASVIVSSSGTTSADATEVLPTTFALHRNYPNPFNPTTTIAFDVPSRAHVKIVVYNALGEQVGIAFDGERPAGSYTASFDASVLPSGMYFYRMKAGEFSAVRKMSLVK